MDRLMAFLQKYVGGFFNWWQDITGLPTVKYGDTQVDWSIVVFITLVIILMVLGLPGGLIYG